MFGVNKKKWGSKNFWIADFSFTFTNLPKIPMYQDNNFTNH